MSRYVLTPMAQQDLADIRAYYLEEFGYRAARQMLCELVETLRFVAQNPSIGHEREDLAESRRIRFGSMRDFLILYTPETNPLQVVMIVRGSQDVPKIIDRRRL